MTDLLHVAARRVLPDALQAVRDHLDALVLVGAQAVYTHAGESDLAVAPTTTDGDLAIDPKRLASQPIFEDVLGTAGFEPKPDSVGIWETSVDVGGVQRKVQVDFLVPASLGGAGRRGARIPPHGKRVARKVVGLEGALVDRDMQLIASLDPSDQQRVSMATLKKKDRDGFELQLGQLIARDLGESVSVFITVTFHQIDGDDICQVAVEPCDHPVYVEDGQNAVFYLRTGNATRALPVNETVKYVQHRWGKAA